VHVFAHKYIALLDERTGAVAVNMHSVPVLRLLLVVPSMLAQRYVNDSKLNSHLLTPTRLIFLVLWWFIIFCPGVYH
jgi:hypothetical protein